jgi:hypothetical protein
MSDLGWRADGIERARAAGGVELEVYRRPGFTGGRAVPRVAVDMTVSGSTSLDPEPPTNEDDEMSS